MFGAIAKILLNDIMLMLIKQQNTQGGLLGQKLMPVDVDSSSDRSFFAEEACELLGVYDVDVVRDVMCGQISCQGCQYWCHPSKNWVVVCILLQFKSVLCRSNLFTRVVDGFPPPQY